MDDNGFQGLGIAPVMAGEVIEGTEIISPQDIVVLKVFTGDGESITALLSTAGAMTAASALSSAVGHIARNQVDDEGRKLSIRDRLAFLSGRRS